MVCWAFDLGITHFDLANNYGPPPGQAEAALGKSFDTSPDPRNGWHFLRGKKSKSLIQQGF